MMNSSGCESYLHNKKGRHKVLDIRPEVLNLNSSELPGKLVIMQITASSAPSPAPHLPTLNVKGLRSSFSNGSQGMLTLLVWEMLPEPQQQRQCLGF